MPEIHIPPATTRRWTGVYPGSFYGTLWKTFNVDLDRNEGRVSLSRRMLKIADTSTDSRLQTAEAFVRTDADGKDRYWALSANNRLFNVDSNPTGTWATDTLDSSPLSPFDMSIFEIDSRGDTGGRQQLFVPNATDISVLNDTGDQKWTGSWWVTKMSQPALKTGVPHPVEYFPFRRIILIGDGNKVHTVQRASITAAKTATNSRLILPTELQVAHIFCTSNRAWILCSNIAGGNGKIVEWDGFSETYNDVHDGFSANLLAGIGVKEIPVVVNDKGLILEYVGKGFAPMERNGQRISFPITEEKGNGFGVVIGTRRGGIKPRGITTTEDGLIYINTQRPLRASPRQGAGIWCLNPETGRFYNKYSFGYWGDTDFGQQFPFEMGALYSIPSDTAGNTFLVGGGFYTDAAGNLSNYKWATLALPSDTTATRGYFITQFMTSEDVRSVWDEVWTRFKKFRNSNNRIVVKGKGVNSLVNASYQPLEATCTWTSTSTFTLTLAAGDDPLAVGDEVEFLRGPNSGVLAHITVISGAHGALQTITIDETVADATNSSTGLFDRWKKLGVISDNAKYEAKLNIGIDSSFLQLKIELRGPSAEMELSDLILKLKDSPVQ